MTDLRALLDGVARYLIGQEREPGVLVCRKHRIEHTGTAAYLALLDAYRPDAPIDAALRVALRVCDRTREDPAEAYGAFIVLPGSRDPHNHSNNAIDCGSAIDALATFARLRGDRIPKEALVRIEETVRRVTDTYLVPHAMPKEIPAQRLWSLAAIGSAYAWLGEPRWREAGLAAADRSMAQCNPDGSWPYTPLGSPRSHEGSSDASAFYQSRPPLFLAHALRSFGEELTREPYASVLRASCECLLALRRADGTKTTFVEAKPWYWGSPYEVASVPFDAACLASIGAALGEPRFQRAAREMTELLEEHREADGGITSHRGPEWNFQCRFFWNAHCAWLARAAQTPVAEPAAEKGELRWFPDAGLARYADGRIVVLVRGKKPRSNVNHGSPFGGGGLLHASARVPASFALASPELVGKREGDRLLAGEWRVVPRGGPGFFARLACAWRENADELRFSLWVARVRARSDDFLGAARWLHGRMHRALLDASRAGGSSGTATEAEGQVVEKSLAFRGTIADAFGRTIPGLRTIRRYAFEPGGVRVGEALVVEREVRACSYRLPRGAIDAEFDGAAAKVREGVIRFGAVKSGSTLAVRYRLAAP